MPDFRRHSGLETNTEDQDGSEANQRRGPIGVTPRGDRVHAAFLEPLGQQRDQASRKNDAQCVESGAEADHAAPGSLDRVVVLNRGGHGRGGRDAYSKNNPEIPEMSDFGRPGIQGIAQAEQSDAQHDDRSPADAVGQHPEWPDQDQADDFRDPGKLARDHAGNILIRDSKVLGEDVGLGEVHVRHHPDADQGCVHVDPEVGDAHSRCELDLPYARAGAAVNAVHRKAAVQRRIRSRAQPRRTPASSCPAPPPRQLRQIRTAPPARRLSAETAPTVLLR